MERDLTSLGLLASADPVVKGVMLVLALASIACWAVAFEKLLRVVAFSRQVRKLELYVSQSGPAGTNETWLLQKLKTVAASEPLDPEESRIEYLSRLEKSMQTEGFAQLRRLQSGLPFLATVGSTAPFVGLFGTVWGIMHSFTGIAAAKDTSLAVVAPGIAEALFATAIGLAAAIPAVIFYNQANVSLGGIADRLSVAIGKIAKAFVYGSDEPKIDRQPWREIRTQESQALKNGGMDAQ